MSLGQNIYRLRTDKNMSQEDFAAAMEVSRQSVSKWENDMAVPELEKLIKMVNLFEISLDELVGNTPPEPKTVLTTAPVAGITTGDLISIVLLFLAITIPILLLITAELHNSVALFFISLFLIPPLASIVASKCSPNNQLIRKVYIGYNILMAVIIFIVCLGAPHFGLLLSMIYLVPIFLWSADSE